MQRLEPNVLLAGKALETSAPGRICLFGEHQDYLGLPVIAAAVDLRVTVRALPLDKLCCVVHLPDIGEHRVLSLSEENRYEHERDYLPAAINILLRQGVSWPRGYDVTVRSTIPINSGASSSSALQVAWCAFLLASAGDPRAAQPTAIARLAYESEVLEFRAPGGMMDHFASALGGVIWLDTTPPFAFERLLPTIGEFVLVDSGIPKDTNGLLRQRRQALEALGFDFAGWKQSGYPPLDHLTRRYSNDALELLEGSIANAHLTNAARQLLKSSPVDQTLLGQLLNKHHFNLSKLIKVSHPRIDEYLAAGLQQGALGGKINGSGCGGSFFFLAQQHAERIRRYFIEEHHLRAWVVRPSHGVQIGPITEGFLFREVAS
ncbi:MAG: mevalonate kinase family protein [Candidatus Sumerlaeaceae bacterium]|jgi:galactokinase